MADVGNVHDTVDVVAFIAECLFKNVLHNITAQVSNVRKMINGRSAGVHFYTARCVCLEFSFFMGCRIIKIHKRSLLFSFRADTDAEVMIHRKAKKRLLYPTRISETPRAVPVFRVLHWFLIKINISIFCSNIPIITFIYRSNSTFKYISISNFNPTISFTIHNLMS